VNSRKEDDTEKKERRMGTMGKKEKERKIIELMRA
jgi:hypothetical protein